MQIKALTIVLGVLLLLSIVGNIYLLRRNPTNEVVTTGQRTLELSRVIVTECYETLEQTDIANYLYRIEYYQNKLGALTEQ